MIQLSNMVIPKQTILVVDDEPSIRDLFKTGIESHLGYRCITAENGHYALEMLLKYTVDVVITDIDMPEMDGIELLKNIKKKYETDVIVITGLFEEHTYEKLVGSGAKDFIAKPVTMKELFLRLNRVVEERTLHSELREANTELKEANIETLKKLAKAAEFRDDDTGDHINRISRYCVVFAEKLSWPKDRIEYFRYASPMHDVGKIGIPDNILLKPGKLTVEEFEKIKEHTTIGAQILSNPKSAELALAHKIALTHHEKWNGMGYPKGLSEEDIPIEGRIVGLVDTFDALKSDRPYKDPYPDDVALGIIKKERGKHFDPELVDIFVEHFHEFAAIRQEVDGEEFIPLSNTFQWSERDQELIDQGLLKYR